MLSMQANTQDPVLSRLDDAYNAGTLSRHNLSIFSRRGTETPEPQIPGARGMTQSIAPLAPRISLRNSPPRAKKSRGTILNAVPIKSSKSLGKAPVRESSPLDFACEKASEEATMLQQDAKAHKRAQSGHKRGKLSEDRIGVWVDGIIHWDEGVRSPHDGDASFEQQAPTTPVRARAKSDASKRSPKPNLAVVIPQNSSLLDDKRIAALAESTAQPARRRSHSPRKHHGTEATHPVSPISAAKREPVVKQRSFEKKTALTRHDALKTGGSLDQREDPSRSSSNASSSQVKEEDSVYSAGSSATSVDGQAMLRVSQSRHKLSASSAFSIVNPTVASVLDDLTPVTQSYANKPLPPIPPISDAMRQQAVLPTMEAANLKFPTPPRSTKSTSSKSKAHGLRKVSTLRKMKSVTKLDQFDEDFMKTSPYNPAAEFASSEPSSPTLSEAEDDLQESLGRLSRHISMLDIHSRNKQQASELDLAGLRILNLEQPASSELAQLPEESQRDSVAMVMQPPSRVPTIPKKSRRRDWRKSTSTELNAAEAAAIIPTRRLSDSMTPVNDAPPSDWWTKHRLSRSVSSGSLPKLQDRAQAIPRDARLNLPSLSRFAIDDGLIVVEGPIVMRPQKTKPVKQAPTQQAAEGVLLQILATLTSMDDLMNTVLINKGMYRVYMENQLRLIKTVCRNQSPPAWELREWCPPRRVTQNGNASPDDDELSFVEHTPVSYMRSLKRDTCVIDQLKKVIVTECSSFIRKETTASMVDRAHPQAQRITDAIWRIWTFCAIFGSQKGRDEDLTGQLDWLKGGGVANNLDCAATVNIQFDFDVASILLNAPEHFGRGNDNGLTADQLYDITEIWTCMAVLLQGYLGHVELAREHGVYDSCNITNGDLEAEEYMLEEWMTWILTLGPLAVLEMAQYATSDPAAGFTLANQRGWTRWAPPVHTTSRVTFLKEPVGRLYEERVTAANAKPHNEIERAEKENSRRRIAAHAMEIRIRRQDSAFKRVPLIDMTMERPMSILSTLSGGGMLTPRFPPKQMQLPLVPPAGVHPALRSTRTYMPSNLSVSSQLTPPQPSRSATPDEREALRVFGGMAESTAELAVQRIVSMGFTEAQAKHALKTTDTGDGLRVDRAVDMLLRSISLN